MSYRLRIYAPTGGYVTRLDVYIGSQRYECYEPASGSYWFDMSGISEALTVYCFLSDGVTFNQWVYTVNNQYQYTESGRIFGFSYSSAVSDLQLRVDASGNPSRTYYAVLGFDANGGTGAPGYMYGSWVNTQPYVRFTIPAETPTRPGYAFAGWNQQADGSGAKIFLPGYYFDGWGQTSPPGPTYLLYAMWTRATSGVTAMIYDNGWGEYKPMIYDNGWHEYEPVFPGG